MMLQIGVSFYQYKRTTSSTISVLLINGSFDTDSVFIHLSLSLSLL